jgi:hypothetical protein
MSQLNLNRTPTMSFLTSNKNKRLLLIDGYVYQQNKSTAKVTYWVCQEKMCWAGVHLDSNDQFLKYTKADHTHMPMPERHEILKMMEGIKDRVKSETTAIGQIFNEELTRANLSKSALAIASTAKEASEYKILLCRKSNNLCLLDPGLNRARRQITPVLPTSMDFDISVVYQQTIDGERYLLADRVQRVNGTVVKRIIVFATDEQLRLLFTCSHIMMDGTFASCPHYFDQIYSIHGMKNDQSKLLLSSFASVFI